MSKKLILAFEVLVIITLVAIFFREGRWDSLILVVVIGVLAKQTFNDVKGGNNG
jgi:uncharacterized membrane protein YobD (UPF0266 family)